MERSRTLADTALDLRLVLTNNPPRGWVAVKTQCLNPEHKDTVASLAVYPDNLHCFGCGWHVSNPDVALAYLTGKELAEAVKVREHYMSGEAVEILAAREAQEVLPPLPSALADVYNAVLNGTRKPRASWLLERGLSWETINAAKLGHDGQWFVIPVFGPSGTDELVTLRYRIDAAHMDTPFDTQLEKKLKYRGYTGRNSQYLYPEWLIAPDTRRFLVLCEGELDALRLWQEDIPALAVTNGAGQCDLAVALLDERIRQGVYKQRFEVLVATDMDERGQQAAEAVLRACEAYNFGARRLTWDSGVKDVTEHLSIGGQLDF